MSDGEQTASQPGDCGCVRSHAIFSRIWLAGVRDMPRPCLFAGDTWWPTVSALSKSGLLHQVLKLPQLTEYFPLLVSAFILFQCKAT